MRKVACKLPFVIAAGFMVICYAFTYLTPSYPTWPASVHTIIVSSSDQQDRHNLFVASKMAESFTLSGAVFNENGAAFNTTVPVKVSLIHSFSPDTENNFRKMMIDPTQSEHHIFANSPAILNKDGRIITVMRIWLEKEIWGLTKTAPTNTFSDNYFYVQHFNTRMEPLTHGQVLGIPTPIQWSEGDGPIEPRIFEVNNTIYLTFNTGIYAPGKKAIDSTFIWDYTHSRALIPKIRGGQPMVDHGVTNMPRDKHWAALVDGGKLYFTYNLDPLRVMECDLTNADDPWCQFIHKEGPEDYSFKDLRDGLRGGTPFIPYKYPYYISLAHGTFFRKCINPQDTCDGKRYYTVHIIVAKIKPTFKIVYTSEVLDFPKQSLLAPIVRYRYIEHPFVFPVGLMLENPDSMVLGGHINDHSSVLYRVTGIQKLMEEVIARDATLSEHGPPMGTLQNFTRQSAERFSGLTLYSG